jgi:hypothetical protein
MLKVHMSDGLTADVNLDDEAQFKEWANKFADPIFQASVTGLTITQKGVQYSLPKPQGFQEATLTAEPVSIGKGGERIVCLSDNMKIQLMVHSGQRAARVAIKHRWKQVFNPKNP